MRARTVVVTAIAVMTSGLPLGAQLPGGDMPVSCTGTLPVFDDVRMGEITSEIRVAHDYYFDPRNTQGTLEQRRAKLDSVTAKVFTTFIAKRRREYQAVTCHYRGVDWNRPGQYSWKTLTAQPGFAFIPSTLKRTMNGDWKGGPQWGPNNSTLSWRTGGHHHSDTFAEVDAEYFEMDKRVIEELNAARKVLFALGIPTTLPGSLGLSPT